VWGEPERAPLSSVTGSCSDYCAVNQKGRRRSYSSLLGTLNKNQSRVLGILMLYNPKHALELGYLCSLIVFSFIDQNCS